MIADDLVLTKYGPNNGTGIPTDFNNLTKSLKSLSLEIHRRFAVCVCVCVCEERERIECYTAPFFNPGMV